MSRGSGGAAQGVEAAQGKGLVMGVAAAVARLPMVMGFGSGVVLWGVLAAGGDERIVDRWVGG